ncbi:hypothetical protein ACFXKG_18390 [Streptomyces sp. NPDC059255]|uniref:hypothetical protein n=1 Tax=Streptomyces sp. NPDC059255 TaxID=3346793 RepID=UPI00368A3544
MSTTTIEHLTTVITHWPDLQAALATRAPDVWPPAGRMSDYLTSLDRLDDDRAEVLRHQAAELRSQERDPGQIGASAAPLRLALLDVMIELETDLLRFTDAAAGRIQRQPYEARNARWSDRIHREVARLSLLDAADPSRWGRDSSTRTTVHAARWLRARAQHQPGPFCPMPDGLQWQLKEIARLSAHRVAVALDITGRTAVVARPCTACGGRIEMRSAGGEPPVARCTGTCGRVWTILDIPASA